MTLGVRCFGVGIEPKVNFLCHEKFLMGINRYAGRTGLFARIA